MRPSRPSPRSGAASRGKADTRRARRHLRTRFPWICLSARFCVAVVPTARPYKQRSSTVCGAKTRWSLALTAWPMPWTHSRLPRPRLMPMLSSHHSLPPRHARQHQDVRPVHRQGPLPCRLCSAADACSSRRSSWRPSSSKTRRTRTAPGARSPVLLRGKSNSSSASSCTRSTTISWWTLRSGRAGHKSSRRTGAARSRHSCRRCPPHSPSSVRRSHGDRTLTPVCTVRTPKT